MDDGVVVKGRLVLKVVPWMNRLELETVYTKLYSDDPLDQRWAVDRICAWTARGNVPVGVNTTQALVRAKIQDYTVQYNISLCSSGDVSLMYSMALVRFVNLISEHIQHRDFKVPLRKIARQYGIPDWVIQLRHKATHSSVPPIEKLRSATAVCLDWLNNYYWKPELENCHDYCPESDDDKEAACKEALLNFQSSRCQFLFGAQKFGGKIKTKTAINDLTRLTKQYGKCLISMLTRPEFLLSLTACSKPLVESSDCFIQEEAVSLPKNIEKFWMPVISILHKRKLIGELLLNLLKSAKNLPEENQRMAFAWVWKILEASAESWGSSTGKDSDIAKLLKHDCPVLNWFELMEACLHTYSKYIPAVLPILVEHVYPPIPTNKKNCLMGLVAIATGALANVHSDSNADVSKEEQRVYDIDNIKTVLELQDVVDRGETSLYHTENPWKLCTDDINWADYPIGYVFGLENGILDPKALQLDIISSQVKTEDKHSTPSEAAVVDGKCDVNKSINETTEMSVDEGRIEEELDIDENASGCHADFCYPEDVVVL